MCKYVYIYIYIYMYVCMYRERERERERDTYINRYRPGWWGRGGSALLTRAPPL